MSKYPGLPPIGTSVRIMLGNQQGCEGIVRHWCVFEMEDRLDTYAVVELDKRALPHLQLVTVPTSYIAVIAI